MIKASKCLCSLALANMRPAIQAANAGHNEERYFFSNIKRGKNDVPVILVCSTLVQSDTLNLVRIPFLHILHFKDA